MPFMPTDPSQFDDFQRVRSTALPSPTTGVIPPGTSTQFIRDPINGDSFDMERFLKAFGFDGSTGRGEGLNIWDGLFNPPRSQGSPKDRIPPSNDGGGGPRRRAAGGQGVTAQSQRPATFDFSMRGVPFGPGQELGFGPGPPGQAPASGGGGLQALLRSGSRFGNTADFLPALRMLFGRR